MYVNFHIDNNGLYQPLKRKLLVKGNPNRV